MSGMCHFCCAIFSEQGKILMIIRFLENLFNDSKKRSFLGEDFKFITQHYFATQKAFGRKKAYLLYLIKSTDKTNLIFHKNVAKYLVARKSCP
jgi:hypothetical protein